MYAINVADLTRPAVRNIVPFLIGPVTPNRQTVTIDKSTVDSVALILECPDEQARAIIDVLHLKLKGYELRAYEKQKTWKRI